MQALRGCRIPHPDVRGITRGVWEMLPSTCSCLQGLSRVRGGRCHDHIPAEGGLAREAGSFRTTCRRSESSSSESCPVDGQDARPVGGDVARHMANGQMIIFLGRAKQYTCEKRAKRGRRAGSEWRHCRDAADDGQKCAVLGGSPVFDGRDDRRAKLMDAQGTGKMTTGEARQNRCGVLFV